METERTAEQAEQERAGWRVVPGAEGAEGDPGPPAGRTFDLAVSGEGIWRAFAPATRALVSRTGRGNRATRAAVAELVTHLAILAEAVDSVERLEALRTLLAELGAEARAARDRPPPARDRAR